MRVVLSIYSFVLILMLAHVQAQAQGVPPSAAPGREAQQFRQPPPPRSAVGGLIEIPSTLPDEAAAGLKLTLARIVVEGSTVYGHKEFDELWKGLRGRQISIADVYAVRDGIRQKYSDDGYLLVIPVIVPQTADPKRAVIRIKVVEAYIDRVVWPDVLRKYRDFFSDCSREITSDRPARRATIERCLLLSRDLPGLTIGSTLKRSDGGAGATTLIIDATEKPIDISGRTDNRGIKGRGPLEYFTSASLSNVLRQHEAFTVSYGGAYQREQLQFFEGAYRQVLTATGLTLSGFVNWSTGRPGIASLTSLGYATNSLTSEIGLSLPVIRAREQNLTLGTAFFTTDAQSTLTAGTLSDDHLRGVRARLNADRVDTVFGTAATNQLLVTFSQGIEGLGSSENGSALASRASGRVDFTKLEATVSRLQALVGPFSLYGSAMGQWAASPLLLPEQCSFGGRFFGRGFDPLELSGDRCWAVAGELRYDVPVVIPRLTQTQLYGFADHGEVYRVDAAAGVPGRLSGTSAGGGLRLGMGETATLNLEAAKPIDGRSEDAWRYFFVLTAKY